MLDTSLNDALLTRQPILDPQQTLVGYALALSGREQAGSAAALCAAWGELGMRAAFGHSRAFVRIDPTFFHDEAIDLLPADSVVLELACDTVPDEATLDRCRDLRERRYALALADYAGLDARSRPLLGLVDFVKIDVRGNGVPHAGELAGALQRLPLRLVAEGVDTRQTMEACRAAGFSLFQGHYFAQPEIVRGRRLTASQSGLLRLIQLVARDAETREIEDAFKREPALALNLLRLVNAVGSGYAQQISSVRHAIALLGRRQLQRWLQLLLMVPAGSAADATRAPLLQVAALRGRMLETLAGRLPAGVRPNADDAFVTGILSMMPAALGLPLDEILDEIAPAPALCEALLAHAGVLGRLLALLESFDAGDVAACDALLAPDGDPSGGLLAGLDRAALNGALAEALRWINGG